MSSSVMELSSCNARGLAAGPNSVMLLTRSPSRRCIPVEGQTLGVTSEVQVNYAVSGHDEKTGVRTRCQKANDPMLDRVCRQER